MKICYGLFGLLFCFAHVASAQTSNCEQAAGEAILDTGNVRAIIPNRGGLFISDTSNLYGAPKNEKANLFSTAGIWIAGYVDGELRGAAANDDNWEFWPGPLDEAGNPPVDCSIFDKVWEITSQDLEVFIQSKERTQNLISWPWHLGAPVIDGDDNPNNYNLEEGDLPELLGTQRLWWVMNDRGNVHESTGSTPIGLEVQGSVHAYNHPGFPGNTTFYEYTIVNKNLNTFTDAYFSFFGNVNLGDYEDDFFGSDSLLHLAYAYNADNEAEGINGNTRQPPAIGITFLKTAIADADGKDNDRDNVIDEAGEMLGAYGVMRLGVDSGVSGQPSALSDYYNYMRSRWKDGNRLTVGGNGRDFSDVPINFIYPGNPVNGAGWSERNPGPHCGIICYYLPADHQMSISSGPFSITAGDTLVIQFAIVWSRGENHLDSITTLKNEVRSIRTEREAYFLPNIPAMSPVPLDPPHVLGFAQNFPNPFAQATTLRYSLPKSMQVKLAVYDILGREIELLVDAYQDAGIYTINFDAEDLPAGLYLARIELDHLQFTKRMMKTN